MPRKCQPSRTRRGPHWARSRRPSQRRNGQGIWLTRRSARRVAAWVFCLGTLLLVAVGCNLPQTSTVGGTVSGLSGTVVLEDNGGDNLSVSANGPFTFATGLAQNVAYTVSVKTNPSGQLCTVSNASGTMGTANVTNVAVSCAGVVTDDFNRPDGSLGPAWTPMADGGLAIASQVVTGTSAAYSGDIRIGESYSSDQSSQIEVTATQLSGGQWIGPAVRGQNGGLSVYVGLYWWNNGNPELELFKRTSGTWTELGSPYVSGPLAAGTRLTLSARGSTLSFAENGTVVISATDAALSGGAPGIMADGTAEAGNWAGVGALGPATTSTVGGTVSGLSGTVVLEDNGGDNLSVSANGPFTFATGLAQNVAYTVSVKTNPSGQLCTVSNVSGTMGTANVTNVAVSCAGVVTDDFNRPDGSLGPAWTPMADGGLAIASQVVTGTSAAYSGDIRIGESYSSDQSSQIEVTATQLSGGQWIGPAVRAQNGGLSLYVGLYWWNNGNPELDALQAHQRHLDRARLALRVGPSGGGHPAHAERQGLDPLVRRERHGGHQRHRRGLERGCSGNHGRRHRRSRQLDGRGRTRPASHFHGGWHGVGPLGDGGARGQRGGQPERQRQRAVHLCHRAGPECRLHRLGQDQPLGAALHRLERERDHGHGQRDQRGGQLRRRRHRRLQPARRKPRSGLDSHGRRGVGHRLPGRDRHQRGLLG